MAKAKFTRASEVRTQLLDYSSDIVKRMYDTAMGNGNPMASED